MSGDDPLPHRVPLMLIAWCSFVSQVVRRSSWMGRWRWVHLLLAFQLVGASRGPSQSIEGSRLPRTSRQGKAMTNEEDKKKEIEAIDSALAKQKQLYSLLAGGFAGAVASTITCPIEVIKTQLQSSRIGGGSSPFKIAQEILNTEGIKGFFRGLPPTLVGIIPSRATYFWAYSTTKSALVPTLGDGTLTHILSGLSAGATSNTITNPIWMVKTRMQLLTDVGAGQKAYTGYMDAIRRIFREEGFRGFWKGLSASYWGCSEGCIQFVVYEKLKKRLMRINNEKLAEQGLPPSDTLPASQTLGAAAFSKFLATTATYPHEVVRTRLREGARFGTFKYKTMWQSLRLIAKEEGRKGLYAGMVTHVARVVPNTAIMFLSYEVVNSMLSKHLAGQREAMLAARTRLAQDAAERVAADVELGLEEEER